MNTRRNFLLASAGLATLTLSNVAFANEKQLTPATQWLVKRIDEWKKVTNSPMKFYDDPIMYRMRRYGIYGWYENGKIIPEIINLAEKIPDEDKWFHTTYVDWHIEFQKEDSDFVLRQLVEHYNGRITNTYKKNLAYQTPGYVSGIEL